MHSLSRTAPVVDSLQLVYQLLRRSHSDLSVDFIWSLLRGGQTFWCRTRWKFPENVSLRPASFGIR